MTLTQMTKDLRALTLTMKTPRRNHWQRARATNQSVDSGTTIIAVLTIDVASTTTGETKNLTTTRNVALKTGTEAILTAIMSCITRTTEGSSGIAFRKKQRHSTSMWKPTGTTRWSHSCLRTSSTMSLTRRQEPGLGISDTMEVIDMLSKSACQSVRSKTR